MRKNKRTRLVCFAALAMTLLAGCSHDDVDEPGGDGAAVSFSAGIETATRTASGGSTWLTDDEVGIFMLTPGGTLPGDIARGADNLKYRPEAAGATAALIPAAGTVPAYWPKTGTYDFAAYYPRLEVGTDGIDPATYTYPVNVSDQSGATELDILYARANGKTAGDNVAFTFAHTMAKVRINVVKGDDITDAAFAGIAASLHGMPTTARLSLADGSLTGEAGTAAIDAPAVTPAEGYAATFEAIVIPQAAGTTTGRYLRFAFTNNLPHYWNIPDTDELPAGQIITYDLRMGRLGVTFAGCTITPWDDNSIPATGGSSDEMFFVQPESNSYIVRPGRDPFLIPVSQANRVLTADGLGTTTTDLGGVASGNFTVELVWGDLPVGTGGVIEEIRPYGSFIYVDPGTTAGNAVICVKVGNTIKWSWHIWVTEAVGSATDSDTGITWMDRNLGAGGNTYQTGGRNGLFYEWGRKDAFPGSNGGQYYQYYYTQAGGDTSTRDYPTGTYTTLPELVQNPLSHATNYDTFYGSLPEAGTGNKSWNNDGAKTLYDPCPPGWKVPPNVNWGSTTDWGAFDNNGRVFKSGSVDHFYPATGRITAYYPLNVGSYGYYWSGAAYNTYYAHCMYFNSSSVYPDYTGLQRNAGFPVRCIKE